MPAQQTPEIARTSVNSMSVI